LRLAANVISSNTKASVSFFSSNAGALASSSGGGGDHDETGPSPTVISSLLLQISAYYGATTIKKYAESM
jgi:hypothetical protein